MTLSRQQLASLRVKKAAIAARERAQAELWRKNDLWKQTLEHKLVGILPSADLTNFLLCGRSEISATCCGCGITRKFKFNCNRKWCPRCQPRLARVRAEKIQVWANHVKQPKHLVLTKANMDGLEREDMAQFVKCLAKLRERDCWRDVRGGCASIEVTNEDKGWHLHAHLLLDTDWLDMPAVQRAWASLMHQEFVICKVKDCRGKDYLQEVCKYGVKGSDLAKWHGAKSAEYIRAIRGVRLFFAFGSLYRMGAEIRREIARENAHPRECVCGCTESVYLDELDTQIYEELPESGVARRVQKQMNKYHARQRGKGKDGELLG